MNTLNSYLNIEAPHSSYNVSSVFPFCHFMSPVMKIERSLSLLRAAVWEGWRGGLEPAIHVMSAAPGIGKSTSVQKVLAEAKALDFADECSVIIFVNTLAEGQAYVNGAGLDTYDYAFQTPDSTYSRYGAGKDAANDVPVLIVTHSMARRRLGGLSSFADCPEFHFKGKPRALRIWDEAFLPAEYASFGLNELRMLPGSLHGLGRADVELFESLLINSDKLAPGGTIGIPFAVRDVVDRVGKAGKMLPDRARQAIDAVSKLAGSTATLRQAKDGSWSLVGIGKAMPADIAPMVVLDASARLTGRYGDWSAYGMTVKHLEPAVIDYSPLTVRWWNRGSGLTELSKPDERRSIFAAITAIANDNASERSLIVMKKVLCEADVSGNAILPREIEKNVLDPDRIKLVTWGKHLAINDYREFENVILIGSYEYGESAYDAIACAATGIVPAEIDLVARQNARDGEFMHNVLQAVARVRVRQSVGGLCGTANAYLIMNDSNRRRELVHRVFPGATIEAWAPVALKKQPKRERVLEQILIALTHKPVVTFGEVSKTCGSKDRSFLTKTVKDKRFFDALVAQRIRIVGHSFVQFPLLRAAA